MPLLLSKVRHLLATAETNIGNLTASEGHDTRDSVKALAAQKGVPVVLHLIFRTTDCLRNLTAMGGCAHAEVWGLGCSSACCFSRRQSVAFVRKFPSNVTRWRSHEIFCANMT